MSITTNNRVLAGITVAALSLTLAGTATALAGPSEQDARAGALSKAEKREVKKIAKQIAARQVRKMAPGLNVASAKTAGTATSAQTAVSAQKAAYADTAGTATTAQTAATVGGIDVKKVNTVIPSGGASVVLVSIDGFTLTASCPAGAVNLLAASSVPGGRMRTASIDNLEVVSTQGSNNLPVSGFTVTAGDSIGSMTLEFVAASGKVVNTWLGYRNDAPGCAYFGNYMVG